MAPPEADLVRLHHSFSAAAERSGFSASPRTTEHKHTMEFTQERDVLVATETDDEPPVRPGCWAEEAGLLTDTGQRWRHAASDARVAGEATQTPPREG